MKIVIWEGDYMALIKCPECGKEISNQAKNCPNCGCPINYEKPYFEQTDTLNQPAAKPYVQEKPEHSTVGIAGFTLSIVQLIFGFPLCAVTCIIAFILCSIGLFQKDKKRTFAIIGNIIAFIFLLIYIFSFAIILK